jgi:hypothetical protein
MLYPPVGVHLVISEFAQELLEPPRGFRIVRKLVAPVALAQTLYYNQSIACSKQARDLLARCGMSGGVVSHGLTISEAEAHMLKSQYLEARNILVQALQTISAGQDLCEYGMVQLNLAQIDVCVGATQTTIQQEIDKAKTIFKMLGCPRILQLTEVLQALPELQNTQENTPRTYHKVSFSASAVRLPRKQGSCAREAMTGSFQRASI